MCWTDLNFQLSAIQEEGNLDIFLILFFLIYVFDLFIFKKNMDICSY